MKALLFSETTAFEKEQDSVDSCLEPHVIITIRVPCMVGI